ncbi:MAG: hypothetical protein ACI4JA_04455 [Oscillospiraceae bacterium]
MKGICKTLAENPDQIKRKYIRFFDVNTEKIYEVDTLKICKALSSDSRTLEDFLGELKINQPDYSNFMQLIRSSPEERNRTDFRCFTQGSDGLGFIEKLVKGIKDNSKKSMEDEAFIDEAFIDEAFIIERQIITEETQALLNDIKQMKRYETDIVNAVYRDIIDLCECLVKSSFYIFKEDGQAADLYYVQIIDRIKANVVKQSLNTDRKIIDKLKIILDETKEMVWSCELPNVCERWIEVNPNLKYYDAVFDIYNNNHEMYQKIISSKSKLHFRFIPTEEELRNEKEYRSRMQDRQERLGETYDKQYQDEVISAVDALFEREFQ